MASSRFECLPTILGADEVAWEYLLVSILNMAWFPFWLWFIPPFGDSTKLHTVYDTPKSGMEEVKRGMETKKPLFF